MLAAQAPSGDSTFVPHVDVHTLADGEGDGELWAHDCDRRLKKAPAATVPKVSKTTNLRNAVLLIYY